jgi:Type IV secretion system pilin
MIAALIYNVFHFADACPSNGSFFGFPPWWKYIKDSTTDSSGVCSPVVNFSSNPSEIWLIGLAVLDMLIYLAGIVAVVSVIAAGVGYITAGGDVAKTATARQRIYNSFIGLGIVLIAAGLVAFIGNKLN